jgi:cytosine/uracil/thiamine/allantoin permease
MKLRITPLNIVGAAALSMVIVSLFSEKNTMPRQIDTSGFYLFILGCLIVVTFITDLIFRFTLKNLKRIWIIESLFIFLAAILMLILLKVA